MYEIANILCIINLDFLGHNYHLTKHDPPPPPLSVVEMGFHNTQCLLHMHSSFCEERNFIYVTSFEDLKCCSFLCF